MANRIDRAKLFMPFDALKGLQEALREKEREIEDRRELSEESLSELEKELNRIEKDTNVKIKYYKNNKYIDITGLVTKIDYIKKKIILEGDIKISLIDIIELKVL